MSPSSRMPLRCCYGNQRWLSEKEKSNYYVNYSLNINLNTNPMLEEKSFKYEAYCSHNLHGLMNFYSLNFISHSPSIKQAGFLPINSLSQRWRELMDWQIDGKRGWKWNRKRGKEGRPSSYSKNKPGAFTFELLPDKTQASMEGQIFESFKK